MENSKDNGVGVGEVEVVLQQASLACCLLLSLMFCVAICYRKPLTRHRYFHRKNEQNFFMSTNTKHDNNNTTTIQKAFTAFRTILSLESIFNYFPTTCSVRVATGRKV